jgi:hypothetical protein
MPPKDFWKSKTFWFNVLALLVLVANGFGFADFQADPQLAGYAALVITIINLLLRFATNQGVTFQALKAGPPRR